MTNRIQTFIVAPTVAVIRVAAGCSILDGLLETLDVVESSTPLSSANTRLGPFLRVEPVLWVVVHAEFANLVLGVADPGCLAVFWRNGPGDSSALDIECGPCSQHQHPSAQKGWLAGSADAHTPPDLHCCVRSQVASQADLGISRLSKESLQPDVELEAVEGRYADRGRDRAVEGRPEAVRASACA